MTITPYVDLGEGWFETGLGSSYLGYGSVGSEATFACAGDTMILNGAIEFWRVSHDAVIPPEFVDMTPTTGSGESPTTAGTLPEIDPCTLITLAEAQTLAPEASPPDGPDGLDSDFITQCSFGVSLFVQVYPPGGPEFFTDSADVLDLTIVDVSGIGDWALAQVHQPDPQFGIEETVLMVVAGKATGRVGILPGVAVYPGTPQYQTLLALLELALSRL